METSIMHHVVIVLFVLWLLSYYNRCHPVAYFVSLIYLFLVHERFVMRLRKKLQFEERKQANQRKVLSDSETVRWLNYSIEQIWPICMEQIASQKVILPIIPWFLDKYKPWTAKKAMVQHLYMGRNPPIFTDMRVLRQSNDDDHLVLELGMNFLAADDMSAIIAVKLRKRLGFGMWAKLHMTGMHVEGKLLIGVKFLRRWPFVGRLRVCFAEPPYFQMTVKPIFTHGIDVTVLPGIAGWLDKLLSIAFEQTLVQPNMLVVDMEKFVSCESDGWFFVDEKEPIAHAIVEVVEASDMKPSDLNGLADPYVKGQVGPYSFRTKTQKKTLSPKWQEEFKIPITTWEAPVVLTVEVCDKDHFIDDTLGDCTVNISELRDGKRHDMWLPLQNIKIGRLHLAITVLEDSAKGANNPCDGKAIEKEVAEETITNDAGEKGSFNSAASPKFSDDFEPINVEGLQETGIWVQRPGSEVQQSWTPRKGKSRRLDIEVQPDSLGGGTSCSTPRSSSNNESTSTDENQETKNPINVVRRGLKKMALALHRNSKKEGKAVHENENSGRFVVQDRLSGPLSPGCYHKDGTASSNSDSPRKGPMKEMAKNILKNTEKSARTVKHVFSWKGSKESHGDQPNVIYKDINPETESESSSGELPSSPAVQRVPLVATNTILEESPLTVADGDITQTGETSNLTNSYHGSDVPTINIDDEVKNVGVVETEMKRESEKIVSTSPKVKLQGIMEEEKVN